MLGYLCDDKTTFSVIIHLHVSFQATYFTFFNLHAELVLKFGIEYIRFGLYSMTRCMCKCLCGEGVVERTSLFFFFFFFFLGEGGGGGVGWC